MRLALYHNLTSGGSKREAFEFARQFAAHGHTVDLYAPATANEEFLPLTPVVANHFRFELELKDDLQVRLPLLRKYIDLLRLYENLERVKRTSRQAAAQIDSRRYDFVFAHHDRLVQSPLLFQFLKTPAVYYCAEPMREFYEPPIFRPYRQVQSRSAKLQRLWYLPARRIRDRTIQEQDRENARRATLLVTNSYFSAESLYRAYGLRARVVYLGVDTEKFRPLDLPRENLVLSVGAVSPLKGYDFLIDAAARVPQEKRPRLMLVGNTASAGETKFLEERARRAGVALEMRVNIRDAELLELYNRAAALVYAPVLEPFGFAPLEAMACATPVIAVREGGVRESVQGGETGLLTDREPQAFANAIEQVLQDPALALKLGAQGRERILDFWTWGHAYQRFLHQLEGSGVLH